LSQLANRVTFRKTSRMSVGRDQLLGLVEMVLEPLALVFSLWVVALVMEGHLRAPHMILALVVFSLTFPSSSPLTQPPLRVIKNQLSAWVILAGLLFFFGHVTGYLVHFDAETLTTWGWVAPCAQAGAHLLLRVAAPAIRELDGGAKRALFAGMNEHGLELARRLSRSVHRHPRRGIRG
jgi:putative colanic acid biosynthesis UDP-glucose lipid carrier transferase